MMRTQAPFRAAGAALLMRAVVLACTLTCALSLAACASSSTTRFHTLQPVAASAPAADYAGPPLQVRSVAVPAALDRAELLREVSPGQFEVRDFDHWAAPLPQLAKSALSADLALRLPPGKLAFPGAPWPAAGAELSVDIQSFRIHGGTATMQLSWSLRPRAGSPTAQALPPLGAQLQLEVAAGIDADNGAGTTSQAFSALLGQLTDRIVSALHTARGAPN